MLTKEQLVELEEKVKVALNITHLDYTAPTTGSTVVGLIVAELGGVEEDEEEVPPAKDPSDEDSGEGSGDNEEDSGEGSGDNEEDSGDESSGDESGGGDSSEGGEGADDGDEKGNE